MFGWLSGSNAPPPPPDYPELPSPKTPEGLVPTFLPLLTLSQEYTALIAATLDKLTKLVEDTQGWTPLSFTQRGDLSTGITCVSKTTEGNPVQASKATGEVKGTPREIVDWIQSHEREIDADIIAWEKLKEVAPGVPLFYSGHATPFPVTSRELVWIQHTRDDGEAGIRFFGTSINAPDVPIREGRVRAALHVAGWVIRPSATPGVSTVTRVLFLDPKGSIPTFVVNMTLGKVADVIMNIREKKK